MWLGAPCLLLLCCTRRLASDGLTRFSSVSGSDLPRNSQQFVAAGWRWLLLAAAPDRGSRSAAAVDRGIRRVVASSYPLPSMVEGEAGDGGHRRIRLSTTDSRGKATVASGIESPASQCTFACSRRWSLFLLTDLGIWLMVS